MSSNSRGFGQLEANRAFIMLAIFALVGSGYWFMLPALQAWIIPNAPGGDSGPWLVRPILAFHFGAMAVMTAVTMPLLTQPLQRLWKREDAALGTRYEPFHGRPMKRVRFLLNGALFLVIYASGLVFYLSSWTTVGPQGIAQRLPWTMWNEPYADIVALERVPEGERSESILHNGPWYSIRFKSGRSITLSEDNEGSTRQELHAMTRYIADRSGVTWTRRYDARPY